MNIIKLDTKNIYKNTTPITNNTDVLSYCVEQIGVKAYMKGLKQITENFTEELFNLFGKHNTIFKNEYNLKVWFLRYENETYQIFTAKGFGMSIEIVGCSFEEVRSIKNSKKVIRFVDKLHKELTNNQ